MSSLFKMNYRLYASLRQKLVIRRDRLWIKGMRQKLEFNDEDDDRPETEDEKPMVVVLLSGDLTAEEAEKLQKIQDDEEAICDGKIKFKKPQKGDNCSKDDLVLTEQKDQTIKTEKKDNNSNILSFGADGEDG